jgi:sulfur relay (sulfurtransferase) DsrF/TusC family protein
VSLPNNTNIGENAFNGCTGLKNLTVNNLSIFDDTVFQNTGLTTQNTEAIIKLLYPGKTGFFDTKEFFRANSSLYQTGITADRIIIGSDNIERTQLILDKEGTVADYAFAYCTNLTLIKFGDKITTIGKSVFDNCTSLESIHFGKKCSIVKNDPGYDPEYRSISFIPTLKNITVDQDNETLQI